MLRKVRFSLFCVLLSHVRTSTQHENCKSVPELVRSWATGSLQGSARVILLRLHSLHWHNFRATMHIDYRVMDMATPGVRP